MDKVLGTDSKIQKQIKIFVAIPTIGLMNTDAVHSLFETLVDMVRLEPQGYKIILAMMPRMLVAQAREVAVEKALELNCDYIFFIDDDMVLPRFAFERLMSHNKDIVSALAFERMGNHNPNIYALYSYDKNMQKDVQQVSMRWRNVLNYKELADEKGLVKVDVVGFGCVLIKTSIFKGENKVEAPYFMSQFQVGEDFFFCYKAKQKGIEIYCDTKMPIGHLGDTILITEETHLKRLEEEKKLGNKTEERGIENAELSKK